MTDTATAADRLTAIRSHIGQSFARELETVSMSTKDAVWLHDLAASALLDKSAAAPDRREKALCSIATILHPEKMTGAHLDTAARLQGAYAVIDNLIRIAKEGLADD